MASFDLTEIRFKPLSGMPGRVFETEVLIRVVAMKRPQLVI